MREGIQMDPLPTNTDYDLPADAYVKKWLDDPNKPDSNIRDHVRDRWNGSENELPAFEKAVEVELEKQMKERKEIADFQQRIRQAEFADFVERVSGGKD
jgi:hypothetical protein